MDQYIERLRRERRGRLTAMWAYLAGAVVIFILAVVAFAMGGPGWGFIGGGAFWVACGAACGVLAHKTKERINEEEERTKRYSRYSPGVFIPPTLFSSAFSALTAGGGHRGGAQAHRTGTGGSAGNGSGYSTGGGTSPGVIVGEDQFEGRAKHQLEEVGFAPGVLRGTRSFTVDKYGHLHGVVYGTTWGPDENKARCLSSDMGSAAWRYYYLGGSTIREDWADSDKPPHGIDECHHGFYGYYEGSNDYYRPGRVSGVIEGFGQAVVGTRGFRCMKARIVALHIPPDVPAEVAALVQAKYPAAAIFDTFERMVAEYPPDKPDDDTEA